MKVAIITMPLRHNYGGIMQNYALQRVLKDMGHDVTTLEITKTDNLPLKTRLFMALRSLFYKCVDEDGKFLHICGNLTSEQKLSANTWKFISKHIRVRRINGFPKETEYDAYVVGSDQVWRPKYFDTDISFLAFAKNFKNVKRIAYAASFGTDKWEYNVDLTNKCSQLAAEFNAVSVREKSGIALCKDHLLVDAEHVLDPTLLLSKEDYISDLAIVPVTNKKGVFYYFLDENEAKRELVNKITEPNGCNSYTVNSKVENPDADLHDRIQPPIEDWIRAFVESSFVVTDSFHGTVFSMIFNKPFIVIGNENRGLSRFISILGLFDQDFRLITESGIDNLDLSIYQETPNVNLNKMRLLSIDYLKNNL